MARPLLDDLATVLDFVVASLEADENGDAHSSLLELNRAHCHLSYIAEVHLRVQDNDEILCQISGSTLELVADLCKGFLRTYEERILSLSCEDATASKPLVATCVPQNPTRLRQFRSTGGGNELDLAPARPAASQEGDSDGFDVVKPPQQNQKARFPSRGFAGTVQQPTFLEHDLGGPNMLPPRYQLIAPRDLRKRPLAGPSSYELDLLTDLQTSDGTSDQSMGCSLSDPAVKEVIRRCLRTVHGTLNDVTGLEDIKREIGDAIFLPLALPHLFHGLRQPAKTFLMVGPPGTGKTFLVEKVAAGAGLALLSLSPSSVLSKWSGESERFIKSAFVAASSLQPCIIFIDEIDSLGGQRGAAQEDPASRRLLTELLFQLAGVAEQANVFVFACTNRIQDCDPALVRRFERRIMVPLPDATARASFFQMALQRPEMKNSVDEMELASIIARTEGYSCSDLSSVCRQAAMAPIRELVSQGTLHHLSLGTSPSARACHPKQEAQSSWLEEIGTRLAPTRPGRVPLNRSHPKVTHGINEEPEIHAGGASSTQAPQPSRSANSKRFRKNRSHTQAHTGLQSDSDGLAVHDSAMGHATNQQGSIDAFNPATMVRHLVVGDFLEAIAKISPSSADHNNLAL